jgi:hypothetical protein
METVRFVEHRLGILFPADYVACIIANNGGYPKPNCFDMPNREKALFCRLLKVVESETASLLDCQNALSSQLPIGIYAFADDSFGNYICFSYDGPKFQGVYYWDHETNRLSSVCESFSTLLEMLY